MKNFHIKSQRIFSVYCYFTLSDQVSANRNLYLYNSGMEESRVSNGNTLSRCYLCFGSLRQLLHLGSTIQWSYPIYNYVVCWCNVVWNLLSTCLYWILLWISETTIRTARPDKSNSQTSSNANMVHASITLHSCCRRFTIRSMLH